MKVIYAIKEMRRAVGSEIWWSQIEVLRDSDAYCKRNVLISSISQKGRLNRHKKMWFWVTEVSNAVTLALQVQSAEQDISPRI